MMINKEEQPNCIKIGNKYKYNNHILDQHFKKMDKLHQNGLLN
jgi:hypothetical protein